MRTPDAPDSRDRDDRFQSRLAPTLLAVATLAVFAALLVYVPHLSGFGAGVFKFALAIAGLVVVDALVLRKSNTYVEIVERKNVAYALVILGYCLIAAATVATAQPAAKLDPPVLHDLTGAAFTPTKVAHLDTALTYVGARETRGRANRGPEVDRFARLGARMDPPISWCAAFVSYALRLAGRDVVDARGVSRLGAVATRFITERSVDARDVLRGVSRPAPGSAVVWRRGSSWQGHIGLVVGDDNAAARGRDWYLRCGLTVEGNTSSGASGSQADGDGVYRRTRCIEPGAYFRIVAFTPAA